MRLMIAMAMMLAAGCAVDVADEPVDGLSASAASSAASAASPSSEGPTINAQSRISAGMQRLGASPARGDCFAERVVKDLDAGEKEEAAQIVENATSSDEMRSGVLAASEAVRGGFVGANLRCALVR